MKSRVLLLTFAAAIGCVSFTPRPELLAQARAPQSLTALVAPHALTRDSNADGLDDVVAARVIVPATPTLAEIEAATNLAARLGYETTALSLPLVVRDTDVAQPAGVGVPILVGRTNRFVQRLIDEHAIDIT